MIKELDSVVLTEDIADDGLKRGDVGTIMLLHDDAGYEVEFVRLTSETFAVVSVAADQVRPIDPKTQI